MSQIISIVEQGLPNAIRLEYCQKGGHYFNHVQILGYRPSEKHPRVSDQLSKRHSRELDKGIALHNAHRKKNNKKLLNKDDMLSVKMTREMPSHNVSL